MAVKFKYGSYDFSNNLNQPESEHQERHLERMLAHGWSIAASDLTDVYFSVVWRQDGELAPADSAAQDTVAEYQARVEQYEAELQRVTAERDQAQELARQLQAREGQAPASVQTGAIEYTIHPDAPQ